MKSLYLRSVLALLSAFTLASCGGGSGSMLLQGGITGLTKDGLVLTNGSESITIPAGSTSFQFTTLIAQDAQFDIEIKAGTPTGAVCTASNNKNKANVYTVSQTVITCVTNSYVLGGTVTGLDGKGLVLTNGSDTVAIPQPATDGATVNFTFPVKVPDGSPYGVTILAQPQVTAPKTTVRTCAISNNSGLMPSNDLSPIVVTCK